MPVTNAVVFDEADVALLDNLVMQDIKKGSALIIGFTATPFRKQDNFESKYLASRGFSLLNSPLRKEIRDLCTEVTMKDFLKPDIFQYSKSVKMIHCDSETAASVKSLIETEHLQCEIW